MINTTRTPHGWRLSSVSHRAHVFIAGDDTSVCGQSTAAVVRPIPYGEEPPRCRSCVAIALSMASIPNAERFRTQGISAHGVTMGLETRRRMREQKAVAS